MLKLFILVYILILLSIFPNLREILTIILKHFILFVQINDFLSVISTKAFNLMNL